MVNIPFGSVAFYIRQSIEAGSYSVISREFKLIVMLEVVAKFRTCRPHGDACFC
jgi:hypothetical protein